MSYNTCACSTDLFQNNSTAAVPKHAAFESLGKISGQIEFVAEHQNQKTDFESFIAMTLAQKFRRGVLISDRMALLV